MRPAPAEKYGLYGISLITSVRLHTYFSAMYLENSDGSPGGIAVIASSGNCDVEATGCSAASTLRVSTLGAAGEGCLNIVGCYDDQLP
jgi:hypothetical protein